MGASSNLVPSLSSVSLQILKQRKYNVWLSEGKLKNREMKDYVTQPIIMGTNAFVNFHKCFVTFPPKMNTKYSKLNMPATTSVQ